MYFPILATNRNVSFITDSKYKAYLNHFKNANDLAKEGIELSVKNEATILKTDYVDTSNPYPIVAKGIMTASGLPTAIRMVNGEILFYRTDIGATANPGDEMMDSSGVASEVKTIKRAQSSLIDRLCMSRRMHLIS